MAEVVFPALPAVVEVVEAVEPAAVGEPMVGEVRFMVLLYCIIYTLCFDGKRYQFHVGDTMILLTWLWISCVYFDMDMR